MLKTFGFTKISIHNSVIIGEKNNMIVLGVLYEYSSTEVANTEINNLKLEQDKYINVFVRNSGFNVMYQL